MSAVSKGTKIWINRATILKLRFQCRLLRLRLLIYKLIKAIE